MHQYGWDTLAYFSLRDDKSLFFSSDGEAFIAYAYLQGHALASGDPIGAPESIAAGHRRVPRVLRGARLAHGVPRRARVGLPLYEARGMKGLYLGDEAIIRCQTLQPDCARHEEGAQAVNRVARDHEFTLMRESDASPELVDQLNAISERWRGKDPERGFTMALSQDVTGDNPEMLLAVARHEGKAGRVSCAWCPASATSRATRST